MLNPVHSLQRHKISLALPGFILLALGLHALAFYFFKIVYPPNITLIPPSVGLTILDPAIPEHRALLEWSKAEDPALLSGHVRFFIPGSAALLPLAYEPSFAEAEIHPISVESNFGLKEKLPSFTMAEALSPVSIPKRPSQDTAFSAANLILESGLPFTIPYPLPPFDVQQMPVKANREPIRFLVAISPGGMIENIFIQQTSGDVEFDTAAIEFLRTLRFKPTQKLQETQWGIGIFQWTKGAL